MTNIPTVFGQKMALFSIPGAESKPPEPAITAETIPLPSDLRCGGTLHPGAHAAVGLMALDDVYGVLGMDFLDQLKSYTFDYRTMKFSVRTE